MGACGFDPITKTLIMVLAASWIAVKWLSALREYSARSLQVLFLPRNHYDITKIV